MMQSLGVFLMRTSLILVFCFFAAVLFRADQSEAAPVEIGFVDCGNLFPCWGGPHDFGVIPLGESRTVELVLSPAPYPIVINGTNFLGSTIWGSPVVSSRETYLIRNVSPQGNLLVDPRDPKFGWDIVDTANGWNVTVTNNGQFDQYDIFGTFLELYFDILYVEGVRLADGDSRLVSANNLTRFEKFVTFTPASQVVVPLPGALPLFASVLAGLGVFGWRQRSR